MIHLTFDPFALMLTSHRRPRPEIGNRPELLSHDVALLAVGSARKSFEAAPRTATSFRWPMPWPTPGTPVIARPSPSESTSSRSSPQFTNTGLTKTGGSFDGWQDREARRRDALFLTRLFPQYLDAKARTGERRVSTPWRS